MAIRFMPSRTAQSDLDDVLRGVRDSRDHIVLDVDGTPTAKIVPLEYIEQQEALRETFGRFWDEHKAYMLDHPSELSEEEAMDLAVEIVHEVREERRRRIRDTARRIQLRDPAIRSA